MKFLFQGDSITDAGRTEYVPLNTGKGYAHLLASHLTYENPDNIVYNCGISGHRVVDLFARWKKDTLNLEPDVLTILIGVNDVWHEFGNQNGVDPEKFETVYRMILKEAIDKNPDIRIILMGAFLLDGTATDNEHREEFHSEVKIRREITGKLAHELGLEFINLQDKFEQALKIAPAIHWTGDGVHPTPAGHELIKRAWLEQYESKKL